MFLLIDKPAAMTSHDVVNILRKITGIKKIGHAGTLDPDATGLLIVGIGRESTKQLFTDANATKKTYLAEIVLGKETTTDDAQGDIISEYASEILPSKEKVNKTLGLFVGIQSQTPPRFSAVKIKGRKAYQLARRGKEIKLKPRKVIIYSIKLLQYNYPVLKIETKVSGGTYIRSLARDMGKKLGCGAYINKLRRTRIGKFNVARAVKLDTLTEDNWMHFAVDLIS